MYQNTSKLAYEEIIKDLGKRQLQVYNTLKKLKSATNTMISKELGLPINSITPRTKELRDQKLVGVSKVDKCPITKRTSIFWRCVKWLENVKIVESLKYLQDIV